MKYISGERLKEILTTNETVDNVVLKVDFEVLLEHLIDQCKELDQCLPIDNQWLPIDNNTPKDRTIWLFANGLKHLGNWENGGIGDGAGYWKALQFGNKLIPTHYQKLLIDSQPDEEK